MIPRDITRGLFTDTFFAEERQEGERYHQLNVPFALSGVEHSDS